MGKKKSASRLNERNSVLQPDEDDPTEKKVTIYLVLPPSKAGLKQVMEDLAKVHNRNLTGECIQALEEYAAKFGRWKSAEQPGSSDG